MIDTMVNDSLKGVQKLRSVVRVISQYRTLRATPFINCYYFFIQPVQLQVIHAHTPYLTGDNNHNYFDAVTVYSAFLYLCTAG